MARPNRYQIMDLYKTEIVLALTEFNDVILTVSDIEFVFFTNKDQWKLPKSTTVEEFLIYLIKKRGILRLIEFGTEHRPEKRYIYVNNNLETTSLALSLYPNSYLSHYSAVMFHDLTGEIIKSVYVNHEQSPKDTHVNLKEIPQSNIDEAFNKVMRSTNNFLDYNAQRIYILNGKHTNNLGVIERNGVFVTDIERTLIDIVVRPQYSGGVYEVLEVFKKAKGKASVNRLVSYLIKLNYSYPYHQSIGFYLDKAGYKAHTIELIKRKFPIKRDFYLTYNMKDKNYDQEWKIYYPKNL